jgi:hypothetical protein
VWELVGEGRWEVEQSKRENREGGERREEDDEDLVGIF